MVGPVRQHAAQHDAISELPLVTESATVTDVRAMDRNRSQEIRDAIDGLLARHELTAEIGSLEGPADYESLPDRLAVLEEHAVARAATTLYERLARPHPMLTRIGLQTDEPVEFVAGQYVGLRYDGTSRAYSLSNSPLEDHLELCIRRVPEGRLSPRLCTDLAVGDELTLRGPYGDLALGEPSERDLVFLATGTGVAPLKSMIEYVYDTDRDVIDGHRRDVWLFLGAGWEDDLPYRAFFRRLDAEREGFHFVPALTRESLLTEWAGETDYVQHVLLKHVDPASVRAGTPPAIERWIETAPESGVDARIDPQHVDVYACGINAMVHSLTRAVERLGVPDERVESEGFG